MEDMYQIISDPRCLDKYKNFAIYTTNADGIYELIKSEHEVINYQHLQDSNTKLFITLSDRVKFIRQTQESLNVELRKFINIDVGESKRILTDLITVTLSEPRSGILTNISQLINTVISEYLSDPRVIDNLVRISIHDYSTALHSTNCMLYSIYYAHHQKLPMDELKHLGLIALLHDVGKLEIPDYLLQISRKLTVDEFEIVKKHTIVGEAILSDCGFSKQIIAAAGEHHERLDGSGYPRQSVPIYETSRLIAIIDIFEAVTSWRPYNSPISPLEALKMMMNMVNRNQLDGDLFRKFANSIVGIKSRLYLSNNITLK